VKGGRVAAVAAVLGALLALGSKETAVALPIVALACDAWLFGRDGWRRRLVRVYIPVLAVLAIGAAVRLRSLMAAEHAIDRGPVDNLLTQAIVTWRYVRLLISPVGQTIMHDVRFVSSAWDPVALAATAAWGAALFLAIRARRRYPLVAVGVVWFLAALAPSSSFIPLKEGMAEHRAYLAMPGLILAGASVLGPTLAASITARMAAVLVLAVCSWLTFERNVVWNDATVLWAEAADRSPSMWEPHYAYGDALREAEQCEAAVTEYQIVLRFNPSHRDTLVNLGICYGKLGRYREAEASFKRLLAVDPGFVRAYTNLAALAVARHEYDDAREYYLEAIRNDPRNVLAHMQLAQLYENVYRDYRAAALACDDAVRTDPRTPGAIECSKRNWQRADHGG
jgi:tetratricopeptide (TPR) repeat protein